MDASGNVGTLDPGDVILEINGDPITSTQQFSAAIDQSGQRMSLVILNVRNGERLSVTVNLAY